MEQVRLVSPQGLIAFRGNSYSVPPGLAGTRVTVRHRLGADVVHLITAGGATVATHRRASDGTGRTVRDAGHVAALEQAVLERFSTAERCKHKTRRPPTAAAQAEAARLRGVPIEDTA